MLLPVGDAIVDVTPVGVVGVPVAEMPWLVRMVDVADEVACLTTMRAASTTAGLRNAIISGDKVINDSVAN